MAVEQLNCGSCGDVLPTGAPQGLCPKCLLQTGLTDPDPDSDIATETVSQIADSIFQSDNTTIPLKERDSAEPAAQIGALGRSFGDYELLEEIARGGMGVVYKARQLGLNRTVALKMILAGQFASETEVQRFHTEARAAANLDHPGIVPIYEISEHEGQHFFSMAFVDGESLAAMVAGEPLPPREAAALVKKIAEAIEFANRRGVIHRDLKPANVLIDRDGNPRITDFGLAKQLEVDSALTGTGQVVGTPSYMPPEQAWGKPEDIGPASDVYGLGAILYYLLTGKPPFRSKDVMQTLLQLREEEPVSPRSLHRAIPVDLETVCLKCLRKEPSERYATAQDMAADLEQFLSGESVTARRARIHQRSWRWARNVPLVAGVLGRRSSKPTAWHVLAQWLAVVCVVLSCSGILLSPAMVEWWRLRTIEITTGGESGSYFPIGQQLAEELRGRLERTVNVHSSDGAIENAGNLRAGEADIGFLQADTLEQELKVIAPLYYEVSLVLVRNGSNIQSMRDLPGRRIAVGPPRSGMRLSSRMILEHHGRVHPDIDFTKVDQVEVSFTELSNEDYDLDGAIVTIRLTDPELQALLDSEEYLLIELDDVHEISGQIVEPAISILPFTVPATLAVLAVRKQTPDWLVTECLDTLYKDGFAKRHGFFSFDQAARRVELQYHDAAFEYFEENRRVSSP